MSEHLTYENLAGQINTKFALRTDAEPFELELVEVSEPKVTEAQTYFAAYFTGDANRPLVQAIYTMDHAHFGAVEIFLVPVALEANGCHYEAVFNYLS